MSTRRLQTRSTRQKSPQNLAATCSSSDKNCHQALYREYSVSLHGCILGDRSVLFCIALCFNQHHDPMSFVAGPLGVTWMHSNCYGKHTVVFASPQLKSTSWSRDSIDVFWVSNTSFNDQDVDVGVFGQTASNYTASSATYVVTELAMCTR